MLLVQSIVGVVNTEGLTCVFPCLFDHQSCSFFLFYLGCLIHSLWAFDGGAPLLIAHKTVDRLFEITLIYDMGNGNLRPGRLLESLFTWKIVGELYAGLEVVTKINDMRSRVMFRRAREKGGGDLFRLLLWDTENIQWRYGPFACLHFYGTRFSTNIFCLFFVFAMIDISFA